MTTIMLTIRRFRERTPEEMQEDMNDRQKWRGFPENIQAGKDIQTDLLDVSITEEQFEAIRKSVLEKF